MLHSPELSSHVTATKSNLEVEATVVDMISCSAQGEVQIADAHLLPAEGSTPITNQLLASFVVPDGDSHLVPVRTDGFAQNDTVPCVENDESRPVVILSETPSKCLAFTILPAIGVLPLIVPSCPLHERSSLLPPVA